MKRTLFILILLTACSSFALGQAAPDATRAGDLQVGGTFSFGYPDYSPQDGIGGGAYASFDFKPNYGVEIAFHELSLNTHSPAKEITYEIGPRYHRTYGRYNPYIRALVGRGKFDFSPDFQEDISTQNYWLVSGGAGVDYQLTYRFNIRAEVEYQRWFSNSNSGVQTPPDGPITQNYLPNGLTPILYSVGFAYHFSGGAPSY